MSRGNIAEIYFVIILDKRQTHDIMMLMINTKLYTITEAAKVLGLTRQAVHYLVKNKLLRTAALDTTKKLIDADAINDYMSRKK